VYQETGLPAISLPNGAKSLPPQLVEQLEQFKTIYIWCDDDVPGRDGSEMCVKKLGMYKACVDFDLVYFHVWGWLRLVGSIKL